DQIQLDDVGAVTTTGVLYGHRCGYGVTAGHIEIAIVECRVAEPVSEREQRHMALGCETSVADVGPLVVCDRRRRFPRRAQARQVRPRGLVEAAGKGDRQTAARVDLTGQYLRNRLSAGLARKPRLYNTFDAIEPGHGHRVACLKHDDSVRVDGRDGLDHS